MQSKAKEWSHKTVIKHEIGGRKGRCHEKYSDSAPSSFAEWSEGRKEVGESAEIYEVWAAMQPVKSSMHFARSRTSTRSMLRTEGLVS